MHLWYVGENGCASSNYKLFFSYIAISYIAIYSQTLYMYMCDHKF